jgi:hypothetical protein
VTSKHLDWEEIVEGIEGRLPLSGKRHLAACEHCRGILERVRDLLGLLDEARDLPAPSRHLLERTVQRVVAEASQLRPGTQEGLGERIRRLVATLVGDSLRPAPALRGRAGAGPRTLLFDAETYVISVALEEDALRGQIAPRDTGERPRGEVRVQGPDLDRSAPLSPLGEFVFRDLGAPPRRLVFRVGSDEVVAELPEA